MPPENWQHSLRSAVKFQVTKGQYIVAFIALCAILGLGFSSFVSSRATVGQAKILSDVETPGASIIFTQRETLVYAVRLAQWADGGAPRRDVQIARSVLAQRLAVIDNTGRSMGSRAPSDYWSVLRRSDAIVAAAPVGILPESLHTQYNRQIVPVIDEILSEARRLVVSYQRSFDKEMVSAALATAQRDRINLILFAIFFIFAGLFLLLNFRTSFNNYRIARSALNLEQRKLDETLNELLIIQSKLTELESLDAAKDAFISNVNHELRTPITSIIGYLDLIRDEEMIDSKGELATYFDVLDRNATILLKLVESMLSLSKIDSGDKNLTMEKISVNETISNAIFLLKPSSEKAGIKILLSGDEEIYIDGHEGQINQLFINLLANAVKFSPQDSSIEIDVAAVKGDNGLEYSRVRVTDHGIGIPEADIQHLFTRFFRAANTQSGQFPGTGLGLSIVQNVVERHHGVIHVSSKLGVGTTFTVDIPLFLSPEERLIRERTSDVLLRAINTLEGASPETFEAVTHEVGGTIGFYNLESSGAEILKLSRSLKDREISLAECNSEKIRLVTILKDDFEKVKSGFHG